MKKYIQLIRVKHWLKNILIFLPLFFSKNLFESDNILLCFIGLLIFSFTSSIVYIVNDINDIESDRKHEIKKNRPLASGKVSILKAVFVIIILSTLTVSFISYLYQKDNDILVILLPAIYLILNILYSISLKHKPIIDVVILVSGFLIRVMYGGAIIGIEVSKWLYLMVIFGSFYLGFGKRRNEIVKNGKDSRKVLQFYNKDFLDKNMYVSLTLAIISYSLWCLDPTTIERVGTDLLFWTIPIIMIIFQLYSLNIEGDSHGDPIEVVLADKSLLLAIAAYALFMFFALYGSLL